MHCVGAVLCLCLGILKLDMLIMNCFTWLDTWSWTCLARLGDMDCCLLIQVGETVVQSDGAQEPSVSESGTTRPIYFDSVLAMV